MAQLSFPLPVLGMVGRAREGSRIQLRIHSRIQISDAAREGGSMLTAALSTLPLPFTAPGGVIALNPGGILSWVLAGLLAGWLAGLVVRGRGFGCLGDILLGVIGAFLGAFVLSLLPIGVSGGFGFFETLVVAFLGALALAAIGRLIGGSRRAAPPSHYTRYEWPNRPYGDRP